MSADKDEPCPDCAKAVAKFNRLDLRMAKRGNFGIVPLSRQCKKHRLAARSAKKQGEE